MKSFYFILGLIPLIFACTCPRVDCPDTPSRCACENKAAIACAKGCGLKPSVKPCIPPTPTTSPTPTQTPQLCGSRGMDPCAHDQTCIADPNNLGCSLIADCPGICVAFGPFCGGFANIKCPDPAQVCIDDPRDSCDPYAGGADCGGVCVFTDGRLL